MTVLQSISALCDSDSGRRKIVIGDKRLLPRTPQRNDTPRNPEDDWKPVPLLEQKSVVGLYRQGG